jgi:hypothetical protein
MNFILEECFLLGQKLVRVDPKVLTKLNDRGVKFFPVEYTAEENVSIQLVPEQLGFYKCLLKYTLRANIYGSGV